LRIGDTKVPIYCPESKLKVPDVLFYENAQVTVCDCEVVIVIVSIIVCHCVLWYIYVGLHRHDSKLEAD